MNSLLRSFTAVVDDVDNSDRSIVAKISAGDVDRYNTVIESRGIDLTAYRQNPVVLFEHGKDPTRGSLPIGRNVWIRAEKTGNGRILAKTRFASDPFSSLLYDFYRDGTMRGWSIMILPQEASAPTRDEIRSRPELAKCELIYRLSEIGEYSAVSVPGLASALSEPELRSLSKLVVGGFWSPTEEVKPLVAPIVEEIADPAEVERTLATDAVERMNESTMADGGALVDDDEDEEDESDDDEAEKKKKKKRSADDDADDVVEESCMKDETRSLDEEVGVVDDVEPAAEAVERSTPDPDPVVVPEPVVEVAAEPVVEPPALVLPPLVGRTFDEVFREYTSIIAAWHESNVEAIRDYAEWRRGKA